MDGYSHDGRESEDVANLFRIFGGDAKGYREFEPAPEAPAAAVMAHAEPIPTATSPRELDRLFARPAGQPVAADEPGRRLMPPWRRPS
ncbi:MAG TPA: BcsR/BcsP family cellulose biosynthesis protein [Variovorax sp.]